MIDFGFSLITLTDSSSMSLRELARVEIHFDFPAPLGPISNKSQILRTNNKPFKFILITYNHNSMSDFLSLIKLRKFYHPWWMCYQIFIIKFLLKSVK